LHATRSPFCPSTTLFRSRSRPMAERVRTRTGMRRARAVLLGAVVVLVVTLLATGRLSSPPAPPGPVSYAGCPEAKAARAHGRYPDRKSTRLNSSHQIISY